MRLPAGARAVSALPVPLGTGIGERIGLHFNWEGYVMKRTIAILISCLISTGAAAQQGGVAEELNGYRNLAVNFSKHAGDCNLKDPGLFEGRLKDKLAEIGIEQRDDVYAMARLGISAQKFGAHCVTMVELSFHGNLGKDNIVTSDQNLKAAVDRLGVIPLIIYKDGEFAVQPQAQPAAGGESTTSREAALGMIEDMVDRLKAKRQ